MEKRDIEPVIIIGTEIGGKPGFFDMLLAQPGQPETALREDNDRPQTAFAGIYSIRKIVDFHYRTMNENIGKAWNIGKKH